MPYSWWCEVASALMDQGCVVYWNRGPEEVKRVSQSTPREALEIIPKDLHELYTIIRVCNAFAGNDSGPMQLAAWLNKPLYVDWVVAYRNEWFPWKVTKQAHGNRLTTVTEATRRILALLYV
jgi:ADP-heptose:LPS heptosyltransferase